MALYKKQKVKYEVRLRDQKGYEDIKVDTIIVREMYKGTYHEDPDDLNDDSDDE